MKPKHKGKVHPSPPPPPPPPSQTALSVYNLLPATILALSSILSLQDREVLAYIISISSNEIKKKTLQHISTHKPPLFDCDCFDCYTCYWSKWDSSPNRELIHRAIEAFEEHLEAFEEHLAHVEHFNKKGNKVKRKEREKEKAKSVRRIADKLSVVPEITTMKDEVKVAVVHSFPENEVEGAVCSSGEVDKDDEIPVEFVEEVRVTGVAGEASQSTAANNHNHKGLARKMLPDLMSLFNSRLWNLWSPNV